MSSKTLNGGLQDEVDQLWYTSSLVGLDGGAGLRVRAASAGLDPLDFPDRRTMVGPHLFYALPDNMESRQRTIRPDQTPLCLAYVNAGPHRVLVNKRLSQVDRMGRGNNFFVHLLFPLAKDSKTFNARWAIERWQSRFWTYEDNLPESQTRLPKLRLGDIPAGLNPQAFCDPALREPLAWLIHAFLLTQQEKTADKPAPLKIYLAGDPDPIARLIYGLACCLPTCLLPNLTFSTYEKAVSPPDQAVGTATALIVGTTAGQLITQEDQPELPPWCYGDNVLAINCYKARPSPLLREDKTLPGFYARFAAAALTGDSAALANLGKFLKLAETQMVEEPTLDFFLLLFNFYSAGMPEEKRILDNPTLTKMLQRTNLAADLLDGQPRLQEIVLRQALADPEWWQKDGQPAMEKLQREARELLRTSPQAERSKLVKSLNSLWKLALPKAISAIQKSDVMTAQALLGSRGFIPSTVPGLSQMEDVWYQLLIDLNAALGDATAREKFSWPMRAWLLERWAKCTKVGDKDIGPWLEPRWSDALSLIALKLQPQWTNTGLKRLLRRSSVDLPEDLLRQLNRVPAREDLFVPVLAELAAEPADRKAAWTFFIAVAEQCRGQRLGQEVFARYLDVLLEVTSDDAAFAEAVLREANRTVSPECLWEAIYKYLPRLAQDLDQRQTLTATLDKFLMRMTEQTCRDTSSQAVLVALTNSKLRGLPMLLQRKAFAWQTISDVTARANQQSAHMVEEETLSRLKEAMQNLPGDARYPVLAQLAPYFLAGAVGQKQVHRVIEVMGSVSPFTQTAVLGILGDEARKMRDEDPKKLALCIGLALEPQYARNEPIRGEQGVTAWVAGANRKIFSEITLASKYWREYSAQKNWARIAARNAPATALERLLRILKSDGLIDGCLVAVIVTLAAVIALFLFDMVALGGVYSRGLLVSIGLQPAQPVATSPSIDAPTATLTVIPAASAEPTRVLLECNPPSREYACYVVRPGDMAPQIAAHLLGDEQRVGELIRASTGEPLQADTQLMADEILYYPKP